MSRSSLLLLLVAAPALAQEPVPDTTAPWRYYPLAVGNAWQYEVDRSDCGPPCPHPSFCRYHLAQEVVGDTLVGGLGYSVVAARWYPRPGWGGPDLPPERHVVRYDTALALVVARTEVGEEPWHEARMRCRLDEPFPPEGGGEVPCPDSTATASMSGGPELPVDVGGQTYFTSAKGFMISGFPSFVGDFAADIGFLGTYELESCYEFSQTLLYARVDGIEYGSPVVAAEPDGTPLLALALIATPNPMTDELRLTLDLPAPGAVEVEAFDVLGRRVARRGVRLGTGPRVLRLDVSGWAPGPYVVRATAGGATAMVRVVRR